VNRDDIIRMAREAGCVDPMVFLASYERFAALVAAAEREACAKVALDADDQGSVNQRLMRKRITAAIRARGNA
jgi:hypothetical protein